MRWLTLGTAGHIDHGKTTLVRALTGVDTDRLIEEKKRGITIDLGFAPLRLDENVALGIVDLPGHEAFIRNMLAGATGIDLALLVIAADEGVMPQTREHLAILELLGVRGGVVALTKADLVEPEWLALVEAEVAETLADTSFADQSVIPVSATTGAGVDTLRQRLAEAASSLTARHETDLFRLPIDRVFSVHGTGTVVTGTVWSGQVERDQRVLALPSGMSARVRSIQIHGEEASRALAGQRAALGLVGVERQRIRRGETLVTDAAGWEPSTILTCELRLIAGAPVALRPRTRIRFHLGTQEVMARVFPLDRAELEPGTSGWAQLRLEAPVVARGGDRFVIRSYSPITTIGGGLIVEPTARRRGRLRDGEGPRLHALAADDCRTALVALADGAGWKGVPLTLAPTATRFSPVEIESILEGEELVRVQDRIFPVALVANARERFLRAVDDFHRSHPLRPGIEREELRRTLPRGADPGFGESVLESLVREGIIEPRGAAMARTGYRSALDQEQMRVRDRLLNLIESGGLTPPHISAMPEELRGHPDLRDILRILEEEERVVPLTPDLYLGRSELEAAIAEVRRLLAGRGALAAADFREAIPVSRKYLIPILEYLDRIGVTERRGDLRSIEAHS